MIKMASIRPRAAAFAVRSREGRIVHLRDVARLELGAGDYTLRSQLDGKNAVGIGIFQAPGANALEVQKAVIATMNQLSQRFPSDVKYEAVCRGAGSRTAGV